jgi:hypothetical protein
VLDWNSGGTPLPLSKTLRAEGPTGLIKWQRRPASVLDWNSGGTPLPLSKTPAPLSGRSEVIGRLSAPVDLRFPAIEFLATLRSMTAPDGAQKRRFRTNEPKLLTLHTLYKKLIYNNLRIKRTCAQENNTMKNEPKLCQSMNQRISELVISALIDSFTYSNFAPCLPTRPKPSKTE